MTFTIEDDQWLFGAEDLPAVALDGAVVVILVRPSDGDRGFPAAVLRVLPVGDDLAERAPTDELVILRADQYGVALDAEYRPENDPMEALQQRTGALVDEANALLAGRAWRPMRSATAQWNQPGAVPDAPLGVAGVRATYRDGTLTVARGSRTVREHADPAWEVPPLNGCGWQPYLEAFHYDQQTRVALIELAYHEGHHCPPVRSQYLAVRVP